MLSRHTWLGNDAQSDKDSIFKYHWYQWYTTTDPWFYSWQ